MDWCASRAEIMTPDAVVREVSCGKPRRHHGRWHSNRQVRWFGRFERAESIAEMTARLERTAREATAWADFPRVPIPTAVAAKSAWLTETARRIRE
jgi:hypothetical protein